MPVYRFSAAILPIWSTDLDKKNLARIFIPIGAWAVPGQMMTTAFLVISEMYQSPEIHKCLGSGLCCPQIFRKFPMYRRSGTAVFDILLTACKKQSSSCKQIVPTESVRSERVPSRDLNSPDINNPKRGPQARNNFRVSEIHFIHPIQRI